MRPADGPGDLRFGGREVRPDANLTERPPSLCGSITDELVNELVLTHPPHLRWITGLAVVAPAHHHGQTGVLGQLPHIRHPPPLVGVTRIENACNAITGRSAKFLDHHIEVLREMCVWLWCTGAACDSERAAHVQVFVKGDDAERLRRDVLQHGANGRPLRKGHGLRRGTLDCRGSQITVRK